MLVTLFFILYFFKILKKKVTLDQAAHLMDAVALGYFLFL
jgi:hypothetical protein